MDPLSEVLSVLKPRSYMCGGFEMGGELSIGFPRHSGIKCYAMVSGECWLAVEGEAEPVRLRAGDCYLLPRGLPFRLATDLALEPIDVKTLLASPLNGGILTWNGGGGPCMVGGHFALSGDPAGMLLGVLPAVVHIRRESDKEAMRWCLERLRQELREPQPGGFLVAQQLAYMMLVQALRLHLTEGPKGGVGWLFALGDTAMRRAMECMHEEPGRGWTLQELAERAGMSRSTFAQRFKQTVGDSPMEYLTRWRMLLAGDRLANSRESITEIGLSLGYESDSAFSTAFKRVMGCSPRQYGRRKMEAAMVSNYAGAMGS